MKGLLRKAFDGVAAKRLSAVEVNCSRSHQHEFNGGLELQKLLGPADLKQTFPTTFVWLGGEQEGITEEGTLTWYDSRKKHPTRSEFRLYFQRNCGVMEMANEGDPIFIARRPGGSLMVVITPAGTTMENQLVWLFDLPDLPKPRKRSGNFQIQDIKDREGCPEAEFAVRYILDELGLDPEQPDAHHLDRVLAQFGNSFPSAKKFSATARGLAPDVSPLDDPDAALLEWVNREESLFRRLERTLLSERLHEGFIRDDSGADIEGFLQYSLSVQNRRKARAGLSLENHLEEIFTRCGIHYSRCARTEGKHTPDFLFPGSDEYHLAEFPAEWLTMLGAKSSCKDRWRQVLSEADRIKEKHLLTLEPGISESQTAEMRSQNLRLVVPAGLHATYQPSQREWLMSLKQFIELLRERQSGKGEFTGRMGRLF